MTQAYKKGDRVQSLNGNPKQVGTVMEDSGENRTFITVKWGTGRRKSTLFKNFVQPLAQEQML